MLNCDSYLIDVRTLAVKSFYTDGYQSEIITTHGCYYSKLTPQNLLNKACLQYFSTMQGRISAAATLLNFDKKPPFLIAPNEVGVFPTASPRNANCVWIFNHRFIIKEVEKGKTIVTFMDGTAITVAASKHTIIKQHGRLHTLLSISQLMDRERMLYVVNEGVGSGPICGDGQ